MSFVFVPVNETTLETMYENNCAIGGVTSRRALHLVIQSVETIFTVVEPHYANVDWRT